jgi:transposase
MSLTAAGDAPPSDREMLETWLRSPSIPAVLAQRVRIVLLAADGVGTGRIAARVGTSKQTVISRKHRYRQEGLGGLDDRSKPGRPPVIDEAQIVVATLEVSP